VSSLTVIENDTAAPDGPVASYGLFTVTERVGGVVSGGGGATYGVTVTVAVAVFEAVSVQEMTLSPTGRWAVKLGPVVPGGVHVMSSSGVRCDFALKSTSAPVGLVAGTDVGALIVMGGGPPRVDEAAAAKTATAVNTRSKGFIRRSP
jgi:hypothetical protein